MNRDPDIYEKFNNFDNRDKAHFKIKNFLIISGNLSLSLAILSAIPFIVFGSVPEISIFTFTIKTTSFGIIALFLIMYKEGAKQIFNMIINRSGLGNDDLIYLKIYRLIILLEEFTNEKKLNNKEKAIKTMKEINNLIKKWSYGNLILTKKFIGNEMDTLKKNLHGFVLGNISKGSDEDIDKLINALFELMRYIDAPSVSKIIEINELIKKLPEIEFVDFSISDHLKLNLYNRPNLIRIVPAISASLLFAYYSINYWEWNMKEIIPTIILINAFIYPNADKLFSIEERKFKINSKAQSAGIVFNR